MAEPELSFAGLLRQLRTEARLTQQELAEAASVSPRSISDLERGITRTARKDTALLLADALGLTEPARALFVLAARGKATVAEVLAAGQEGVPGAFAAAATRSLPRDLAAFTGRQAELAQLMGALATAAAGGGVVGIHAIDGMAGIGKTTFAVHAAHRLTGVFPGGQFFLPLHAHTRGQRPVDPADALASLLLTAGVPASQIPPGLDARAGRWRDHVAGKKILLLLDDAAGHDQVAPLLPGTAGSLVLVTSRRRLTALEDASVISLDTLPPAEAAALLARLAARPGLGVTDPAVEEITRLCGYLPLAIGMAASQLRHHPAWTAGSLAAELAAARDRLVLLRAEDVSVAAAFDLSYRDLPGDQQRLFRDLRERAGQGEALAGLGSVHLRTGHYPAAAASYQQALELFRDAGHQDGRAAALGRLSDVYCLTANYPAARACAEQALGLFRNAGNPLGQAWALSALGNVQRVIGDYRAAAASHQQALALFRDLGDPAEQAWALCELGKLQRLGGEYPAAATSQHRALRLSRDLGERAGEGRALNELGLIQQLTGDYPAAADSHHRALRLFGDLSDPYSEAEVLNSLGELASLTSATRPARDHHNQALATARDIGAPLEEARALEGIGNSYLRDHNPRQAAAHLRQAHAIYQHIGAPAAQRVQETLRQHGL